MRRALTILFFSAALLIPANSAEGWHHRVWGHHHHRQAGVMVGPSAVPTGFVGQTVLGLLQHAGPTITQDLLDKLLKGSRDKTAPDCQVGQDVVNSLNTIDQKLNSIKAKLEQVPRATSPELIPAPRRGTDPNPPDPISGSFSAAVQLALNNSQLAVAAAQRKTADTLLQHHKSLDKRLADQSELLTKLVKAVQTSRLEKLVAKQQHLTEQLLQQQRGMEKKLDSELETLKAIHETLKTLKK